MNKKRRNVIQQFSSFVAALSNGFAIFFFGVRATKLDLFVFFLFDKTLAHSLHMIHFIFASMFCWINLNYEVDGIFIFGLAVFSHTYIRSLSRFSSLARYFSLLLLISFRMCCLLAVPKEMTSLDVLLISVAFHILSPSRLSAYVSVGCCAIC